MLRSRVIPCLLLDGENLVKTVRFSNSTYVGDPLNVVRIFNEKEVDELIVLDITASTKKQEPNYRLIEELATECFMPLCYGGGIQTIDHAKRLFSLGVEKICLQSSVLNNLNLIREFSNYFGSQSIVLSVDIDKNWLGVKKLYASSLKKTLPDPWEDFIVDSVNAGIGEIVLNTVYCDGTMKGMDLDLIAKASKLVDVPIIALGGIGNLNDIKAALDVGAHAVAAGSFFVFHGPHKAVLITYPNRDSLKKLLS